MHLSLSLSTLSCGSSSCKHSTRRTQAVAVAHPSPRRAVSCRSQNQGADGISLLPPLRNIVVPRPVYSALCGVVLVGELGLIDAAYSGDWSRIGILTTEQELLLQKAVLVIAAIHAVEAGIAAFIAKNKGIEDAKELALIALRAFAFGALEINKVAQMEAGEKKL